MTASTDTTTNGSGTRERVSAATDRVRSRASDAYSGARERTRSAYGTTREGIDSNPAAALLGGLAIGALLAAILPASRREQQMLGGVGKRINQTAREAAQAAREAGVGKLDEMGVNKDAARQKLRDLAGSAKEAAKTSASAAAQRVKSSPQSGQQQQQQESSSQQQPQQQGFNPQPESQF